MAQTAHFSGARSFVAGGGSNIYSVAVDAKGDVFFTAQNGLGSGSFLSAIFADHPGINYLLGGFNFPTGLAVDSSGNVYVLDSGTGTIDEIVASNGTIPETTTPAIVTIASGISSQGDLTVDTSGDLFFTSVATNVVREIASVNGTIPPSPVIRTLGSGFSLPVGIAVDKLGNVYVGDALNNAVKELLAVNGSVPSNPTILTLGSGFFQPEGLAIDSNGNIFVSDYGNNLVKEILAVNGAIPPSPTIQNLGAYRATQAVALDATGNLYVGDNQDSSGNSGGSVYKVSLSGGTFVPTNLSSQSQAPISMLFTFDVGGTLGSISVLTQGAVGLDFTNAGSGTCTANTAYASGQTCTVNVQFTPRFGGTRTGAVVLEDSTGKPIATGYVQGTGVAAQVNFLPGTETVIPSSGLSGPIGIGTDGGGSIFVTDNQNGRLVKLAFSSGGGYTQSTIATGLSDPYLAAVDGAGNVYVADVGNGRIVKETPTPNGYIESVVDSGFGYPYGVAVDGSGKIYIANDLTNGVEPGQILMETPSAGGYIRTTVVSGLLTPLAVAVDGSGNLYVADANNGNGLLLKETLSAGRYTQSTLPVSGTIGPQSLAVDGVGNVYFEDAVTRNIFEEKLTANGYVQTLLVGDLHTSVGPWGIALDGIGNLYIAYPGQNQIIRADFGDPPSLNFASTSIGSTSADSPQTVTLNNVGNAGLTFPIPAGGNNPSITTNFTLDENAPSACPVTGSGSSQPGTLAAGGSCVLPVSFAPSAAGSLNGSLALTDNNLNAASPAYTTQSISLSGTATAATPTISWPTPAPITYGTALGSSQLNATASVPGTFIYSPASGAVLTAGTQTLTVTFTPTDTADYTTASATVQLTVNKGMPTITWPAPAPINYGTALSGAQLNASANLPGTFAYRPAAGTVLTVGTQALTVTFVPTDTTDYSTATAAVQLTVNKATPVITWPTPAPINYGTPLGSTQLNATANVPGKFLYSPAAGTVLSAGTNTLQVNFTPTDGADYNNASASVSLVVNAPGFSITASPSSVSVKQGVKASSTITISPTGGFNGSVTLSTSGLPKGVSASFSLNPTKTASTVTFSATGSASLGTASVTIIGKSGSLTQTATIALTVTHK